MRDSRRSLKVPSSSVWLHFLSSLLTTSKISRTSISTNKFVLTYTLYYRQEVKLPVTVQLRLHEQYESHIWDESWDE
jgi:hypothetical protein